MINDILDLAKIESGKMDVRLSDFDVATVIATQCDLARPLSEKKNIDLECEVAPGLPTVRQDQGKLEQIINNLALQRNQIHARRRAVSAFRRIAIVATTCASPLPTRA